MAREDTSILIPFDQRKGQEGFYRLRKTVVKVRQASSKVQTSFFQSSDIPNVIGKKLEILWEVVVFRDLKQFLCNVVRDQE